MTKVNMQYPYDCTGTNPLFDGRIHQMEPYSFHPITIGGRIYFIMNYYDFNANCEATTLLTEINGSLSKVPLDNYDYLYDYLRRNTLPIVTPEQIKLPQTIALAQALQADKIFEGPNHDSIKADPIIEITQYVPINPNGTTSVKGGTFAPGSIIIDTLSDNETYYFEKAPSFKLKDDAIQDGLNHYYIDEDGVKRYDFVIDVPEETMGSILMMDNEGNIKRVNVAMIPGKWKYNIVYADFLSKEDYVATKKAGKFDIKAVWPEYRDRHDRNRAFMDGGDKTLDMTFFSAEGLRIMTDPTGPNLR